MVLLNALKSSAQVYNVCTEEERCVAATWSTLTHIHMHTHTHTDAHTDTHTHTHTHTPHIVTH